MEDLMKNQGSVEKDNKKHKKGNHGAKEKNEKVTTEAELESENKESQPEEDKALLDARAEIDDLKDRYMRLLAEYDNYRRRTQKEKNGLYLEAVAEIAKSWLGIIDNIERALQVAETNASSDSQPIVEGIHLIHKQVEDTLAALKIKEIPSEVGTTFDPNVHDAVSHIEDENLKESCIAQVFQKGYQVEDKVIRHSIVQVAN